MLALLERRYHSDTRGNGPAWAFIPMVRNAAGFNATRTMDGLAMGLWPSRGLELHGHEIKVSRGDWLRELKDPAKAEAFTNLVDRWWIVAGDAQIVAAGELPPTWGLMVATGRGLKVTVQAPQLPKTDTPWMPKTFLAALLRAACRTQTVQPEEIKAAVSEALEAERQHNAENVERWRTDREGLRTQIRAFEQASGIRLGDLTYGGGHDPADVGAALRAVLNGERDSERFTNRFASMARQAEDLAVDLRRAAGLDESERQLKVAG